MTNSFQQWLQIHFQRLQKELQNRQTIHLPMLLGLSVLVGGGAIFAIRGHGWLSASETAAPAPPASPLPSPVPSPSPSPTSKRSTTGKLQVKQSPAPPATPQPEPSVTAEQEQAEQAAIASLQASVASIDTLVEMKIAIEVAVPAVSVSVSNESQLLDENGNVISTLSPGTSYTAQTDAEGILFNGSAMPALVWIEPPIDGLFTVGGRTYRGRLLLAAEGGKLWAVNVVSLRNYLYSVVPSEVSPSWDMEALKAQSVAARSYALTYFFQPINALYHMGDDEYFQVYKGIESEADRTREAVDATTGEFVSYQGGIVESLYAASDDIVMEAFQGRGMSQLGALNLAEQGYKYDQILANYYPGTAIGKIAKDTQ